MNYVVIPKNPELSVKKYMENGWEYFWVQYLFSRLSEMRIAIANMIDTLYTKNSDAIAEPIKEVRKKRWLALKKDTQQLIEVTPD